MQHDYILKEQILFSYGGFLAPLAEFEKKISSGALVAPLFSRVEPFVQFL